MGKAYFAAVKYIFFISCLCIAQICSAQDLSKNQFEYENDSLSVFTFNRAKPLPKRAALYSAIFPGVGQLYNKQYWKLGVVGTGLGVAAYFIQTNGRQYKQFRNAYIARIDNNPETIDTVYAGIYQDADLNTLQATSRQYLEYSVIFTTVGYALNVLDAYVSAHLKNFDINDDISMQTKPTFDNRQVGLALVFKFK